jgi:DNA-binding response OmpR family regulator
MAAPRTPRASVLVVDDDPLSARLLMDALESADYRVWHATDGHEAREQLDRAHPDLILLDLMLPDVDGLVLCSTLKTHADIPIIVVSATVRRSDPVLALKLGADDFLRKPFEVDDLLARVEAVLRRAPPERGPEASVFTAAPRQIDVRVGDLVVDPTRRRAVLGGKPLVLTPTEFRLLTVLAAHAETILTREQLAQQVWGYADASNGRTIDVHIRRLRVKLANGAGRSPVIMSVRGAGYRLTMSDLAISAA